MAITPMMQQYLQIKEENPDTLLFFRLGDFYELFFDDAELASKELELTLTGKDCGLSERAPMCGVPYHAVDVYVARLIEKGYKVAICEQMTDPAESKGLVERAVTRVVTPGTVIESNMLDERAASYIMALCIQKNRAGVAFCDVSTGEFFVHQFSDVSNRLQDELARIMPREVILAEENMPLLQNYAASRSIALTRINPEWLSYSKASKALTNHFEVRNIAEVGLDQMRLGICASGALMTYLTETQKNALRHINHIQRYQAEQYMALDASARQSLELTESLRGRGRRGSLLWLIDKTVTAMGSRMLRSWIEQPLVSKEAIEARLDAVGWFIEHPFERNAIQEALRPVRDVERLLSRIAYDSIHARDCLALLASLKAVPQLAAELIHADARLICDICSMLEPLTDVTELLESAIDPDAPLSVKEGGIIRAGYNAELDELREASTSGKHWLTELETQEREETGIKNLKIGFNRVFGYYIEVTKSYYELVPSRYIRKQTLAAAERFITEELKTLEKKILGAEDSSMRLEYQIFVGIRDRLSTEIDRLSHVAQGIKTLDALVSLAQAAAENEYVRPTLNDEGVYEIRDGRHPVVEQSIGHDSFVPNDTTLNEEGRIMIITGPNMAGKSTYMRQVALIVLMAHIGSFVPAESANIAITDRIFTRIGASDDLFGGQSTFMVEMSELSNILKFATSRSLLILDEIGRGTSTFDGLSIAWAAVEHIANSKKCGARTLFATHYHELSELEGRMEGIVNYRITAMERGNEVIFLRKIVKGGADHSYGVAVAALAGLPDSLVMRARQIMARLEVKDEQEGNIGQSILDQRKSGGDRQLGFDDYRPMELVEEVRQIDVMSMSPMDAMNTLFKLVEKGEEDLAMPIRVLDAETVGRIAAGEVVERPASIAKELIENSLDAGASSITIEMKDGGCTYLRVTDNGCGIPPEEARMAFENHATSKITSGDQLTDIMTLGFRGEALPSIAAVSRVTLTTRARGADSGVKVLMEGGILQDVSAAGCPEGTTIVVRDLFFNTPVRKTFLKKPATEAGVLSDMVARLILGNPGVSIRLINNGKNVYHSFGDGDPQHAALAVYGRETAEKLTAMDETEGSLRIHGLVGVGDLEKSNRSHQFFFINGRVVRSPLMTQALESATRSLVTIGQHPMCALSLRLPPHAVDINVHPSKLEVRFRDEASVRLYVESMISRALFKGKMMLEPEQVVAEPQPVTVERPSIRIAPITPLPKESSRLPESYAASAKSKPVKPQPKQTTVSSGQVSFLESVSKESTKPTEVRSISSKPTINPIRIPDFSNNSILRETAPVVPKPIVSELPIKEVSQKRSDSFEQTEVSSGKQSVDFHDAAIRVLGVFANTYILAEYKETLILIDQHAAHERIRYQEYERALQQGTAMQQLLTPMILSMSPYERSALLSNQELLFEAGYEIEEFGERDIQVRAVPYVLGQSELRPIFMEMIDRLDQLKNATVERRRAEVIQASCKKAVKAGDKLSDSEMQALVDEMMRTEAPPTCPHGRPVLKAFRKSEIEKMFKRI